MKTIFGASWKTTVLGYGEAILWYIGMLLHDGTAIPSTKEGWILLVVGAVRAIMGRLTKDSNVTNSGTNAPAHTVVK